jgi:hypothetical protein
LELNGRKLALRNRGPNYFEVVIGNHTTGHFVIKGRHGRRTDSGAPFVVIRPPVIRRFSPAFGPPGTRITIEGANFMPGDRAFLGPGTLTVRRITPQRIVAELPAGIPTGRLGVQRGEQRVFARGNFRVIMAPTIAEFTPKQAPPGSTVVIRGEHFLPDSSVLLAGTRLRIVRRRLPTEVEVLIPPRARTGEFVLVTRGGSARSPRPFVVSRYAELSSFFPVHGLPGTQVVLRGKFFHPGVKVFLAGMELPVLKVRPEEVRVEIPKGARTGRFHAMSHGRKTTTRMVFTVDRPKPALEFTFAPKRIRRGSEVTLFLTPPRQGVMVYYNGRPLPKKVLAGGARIVVTIPSDARSGHFELEFKGRRYRAAQTLRVR